MRSYRNVRRLVATALTAAATSVALAATAAPAALADDGDATADVTAATRPLPHLSTFSGAYDPAWDRANNASLCTTANSPAVPCVVYFRTPRTADVCTAASGFAITAYYSPVAGLRATPIDLYWTGGGAMAGTGVDATTAAVYAMRVQLVNVCADAAVTAVDAVAADVGVPGTDDAAAGAVVLLASRPGFTGSVDTVSR